MSLEFKIELVDAKIGTVRTLAAENWPQSLGVGCRGDIIIAAGVHDALTEQADWNAEYWAMDVTRITGIEELIRVSFERSGSGIFVSALWAGEKPAATEELSLPTLIERIRSSRLGTKLRYFVHKKEN